MWREGKDQRMIAQQINAVPTNTQASLAPQHGGRGVGSFIAQLASASSSDFTPSISGLSGSTALSTSLPLHKVAAKNDNSSDTSNAANAANQAAQAAQAVVAPAQNPQPTNTPATGQTGSSTASSTATPPVAAPGSVQAPANAATTPGHVQLAAALGTGNTVALGAALQASSLNQTGLPLVAGAAAAGAGADPTAAAGTPGGAAVTGAATQAALSAGATQNQAAAGASNLTAQQLASLGLVAANQIDQALTAGLKLPAAPTAATPQSAPTAQTGTTSPAATAAATNAQAVAANATANANATAANTVATTPGAAALNASIIAGATKLATQPDNTATGDAKASATLADPNASVMPNPITPTTTSDKGPRPTAALPNA